MEINFYYVICYIVTFFLGGIITLWLWKREQIKKAKKGEQIFLPGTLYKFSIPKDPSCRMEQMAIDITYTKNMNTRLQFPYYIPEESIDLLEWKKEAGRSYQDIANELGISKSYVQKIWKQRYLPVRRIFIRIMDLVDCSAGQLIEYFVGDER